VNFLNLRKNMKKSLLAQIWHSEDELWRIAEEGTAMASASAVQVPDANLAQLQSRGTRLGTCAGT